MDSDPSHNAMELQETPTQPRTRDELANDDVREEPIAETEGHSLPPCDGGKVAWRLLLAVFVFEALLWGFPLSFGVFQNYYSRLPQFKGNPYISVIGTIASGMSYLAAPIMIPLIKRYAKYRRRMIWVGWPICLLALIAGSFARSLPALILTQGVMYGTGFIIFYYPLLSMVNEFWIARRGMAYGFLCSASGVSGAAMPFCVQALLQRYGYPSTLRVIAAGLFVATGPLIPLLKGRLPESSSAGTGRTDWTFLKSSLFWTYSASNLAMGLGYFFPSLYLPSYASANGLSYREGALLLAMMSVSQVVGQMTFGYLSDRKLPLNLLATSSTLIAGAAVYSSWGLAHSLPVLLVFALIYGFFGAGYTALWGRMGTAVSDEANLDPSASFAAFGLLNMGKGIGNVLAGPISGVLIKHAALDVDSYGSARYRALVLFTGSCMLLSAAVVPLSYVKRLARFVHV